MIQNMIRAARLDKDFYHTVEHDQSYTGRAAGVVVVVAILAGIGSWIGPGENLVGLVVGGVIGGLIGWVVWSAVTMFIGTRVFGGTADIGEMLRVLGFAQAPGALAIIPFIGALVGGIWALIAGVFAVREGLDFTTGKAIGTVIIGWVAVVVVQVILRSIF